MPTAHGSKRWLVALSHHLSYRHDLLINICNVTAVSLPRPTKSEARDQQSAPGPCHIRARTGDWASAFWCQGAVDSVSAENSEYAAFAQRILRAHSRRIGTGDIESLVYLISLADDIDNTTRQAVNGLRDAGYSWTDIGARLGITRQAAQQRWGQVAPRR